MSKRRDAEAKAAEMLWHWSSLREALVDNARAEEHEGWNYDAAEASLRARASGRAEAFREAVDAMDELIPYVDGEAEAL